MVQTTMIFLLLFSQQVPKHASLLVDNLIYKTYVNDNVPMRLPAFFIFIKHDYVAHESVPRTRCLSACFCLLKLHFYHINELTMPRYVVYIKAS
jgi:hypothetical protein